jgi:predicted RNA binding protein YcfA (HicA-like mRNA interferase family)
MASYKFDDFRRVLERAGFVKVRDRKHETWRKILPDRTILRVRISHQHGRDVPRWLFHEMLRQAGLDEATFRKLLGR